MQNRPRLWPAIGLVILVLVCALLITKYVHRNPLIGTWSRTTVGQNGPISITYNFGSNGNVTVVEDVSSIGYKAVIKGTYSYSDGVVTQKYTRALLSWRGKAAAPAIPGTPSPFKASVQGDTLTLGRSGGETFKRVT